MDVGTPDIEGLWIRSRWFMGLDLGQSHDPSALAIIEHKTAEIPIKAWGHNLRFLQDKLKACKALFHVRYLERLPLGMPYPDQVAYVMDMAHRPPLTEARIYIDYTGVGRPVFDLFKAARLPNLLGVTITGGAEIHRYSDAHTVPKNFLVSKLQALLHTGQLQVAAGIRDTPALLRELQDFRVTFTSAGNAIFNARQGAHDDLVLALALAVYGAAAPRPPAYGALNDSPVVKRLLGNF